MKYKEIKNNLFDPNEIWAEKLFGLLMMKTSSGEVRVLPRRNWPWAPDKAVVGGGLVGDLLDDSLEPLENGLRVLVGHHLVLPQGGPAPEA